MQELNRIYYAKSRQFNDGAFNDSGLFDWERQVIDQLFPTSGRVLITSAGGGREVSAMVTRGFQVVATECVPELHSRMLRTFADSVRPVEIILAPPTMIPDGPFDAAIIGWGAYSHLQGRQVREVFLNDISVRLRPGGVLLLSYLGQSASRRGEGLMLAIANALRRLRKRRRVESGETLQWGIHKRFFKHGDVAEEVGGHFEVIVHEPMPYPHIVARRRP